MPPYAEALERALGRVVAEAQARLDLLKGQAEAVAAAAQAKVAEADARIEARLAEFAAQARDLVAAQFEAGFAAIPVPKDGASVTVDDLVPTIEAEVERAMAARPAPQDGIGLTNAVIDREGRLILTMTDGSMRDVGIVVGSNGRDAEPDAVSDLVEKAVAEAVARIEPLEAPHSNDGLGLSDALIDREGRLILTLTDGSMRDLGRVVGRDGESVQGLAEAEELLSGLDARIEARLAEVRDGQGIDDVDVVLTEAGFELSFTIGDVKQTFEIPLPAGEPGKAGPPGKIDAVKDWIDGEISYEGELVAHRGSTWQATRDTAQEPPGEHWRLIAAAGREGRSFRVLATYDAEKDYEQFDVVALNGGSFVARTDSPGPCPGPGWQMLAQRGKAGQPGEGKPGLRGNPGPPVAALSVNDDAVITLINGDGSVVECDLYPLLERITRAR